MLFAVPEYAFGIPGAFKNALDWTVGSGSLYRKPVAVLSVAPPGRGAHVRRALELVLTALDCDVVLAPRARSTRRYSTTARSATDEAVRELAAVVEALAARGQRSLRRR